MAEIKRCQCQCRQLSLCLWLKKKSWLLFLHFWFIHCFVAIDLKLPIHSETAIVQSYFSLRIMQITAKPISCKCCTVLSLRYRRMLVILGYCAMMMQRKLCVSRVLCSPGSSEAQKRCQLLCQFATVTGSGHKKTITDANVQISHLFSLGASRGVASQIAAKRPFLFPSKKCAFPDESWSCAKKDAHCIISILLLLTKSLYLVLRFDHTCVNFCWRNISWICCFIIND